MVQLFLFLLSLDANLRFIFIQALFGISSVQLVFTLQLLRFKLMLFLHSLLQRLLPLFVLILILSGASAEVVGKATLQKTFLLFQLGLESLGYIVFLVIYTRHLQLVLS